MSAILTCLAISAVFAVAAEEAQLMDGTSAITSGVVVFLILKEVFAFVSKIRNPPDDGRDQIAACLDKQTEILERMERAQASILRTAQVYEESGKCPLTKPMEHAALIREIADGVRKPK